MAAPTPDFGAAYQKSARTALIGIFIILSVGAIYLARDFLIPVVLAFFIALTFRPAVRRLAQYHVPPWAAATCFAVVLLVAILAAAYLASGPISGWIADAPGIQRQFLDKVRTIKDHVSGLINLSEQIQEASTPDNGAGVQEVVVKESGLLSMLTLAAGRPVYYLAMLSGALVIAVFLMASGDLFYSKLIHVLPTLSEKKTALRIVYDVEREVSAYLLTVTVINAGFAMTVAAVFHAFGMPTPFLWALLAFILNYIPYIGPITGVGLAALISTTFFPSLELAALPPLAYAALIGIETQIVTPLFLGRRLQLNSVSILLALAFWAWAWGVAGIVVAVPLLVTLRVFCSHVPQLSAIGEFLGSANGDPSPAERSLPAVEKQQV